MKDSEYMAKKKIKLYDFSLLPIEGSIDPHPRLMSTALNILKMEKENVLKFLAAGT